MPQGWPDQGGESQRIPTSQLILYNCLDFWKCLVQLEIIVGLSSLLSLFLVPLLVCVFIKQRKSSRQNANDRPSTDLNPTYGDYIDPDPRVEFVDNNENYSSEYVSRTSRMTDNNPHYK